MRNEARLINIIFVILIIITSSTFGIFYYFQQKEYTHTLFNRYISLAQIIIFSKMQEIDEQEVNNKLSDMGVYLCTCDKNITDEKNIFAKMVYPKITIAIYEYKNTFYTIISHGNTSITLKDTHFLPLNKVKYILFISFIIFLFIIIYYTLIKKSIYIAKARDVFIANIMHELKTPITKGRLSLSLLNDDKNKERLESVFLRMETLISEFASIEELVSTQSLEKKSYKLSDLVDSSIDLLMIDDNISQNYDDIKLNVNYKLFVLAIKNMLDNGLKYSADKRVELINDTNTIITFKSKGDKLENDISYYIQPFSKSKSNSLGLGLYIVDYILKSHNMRLVYKHKDNYNYFSFVYNSFINKNYNISI